jgi:hydroxymethylbilane synthase
MRLGTRASALALAQARLVAGLLEAAGHGPVELVTVASTGDRTGVAGASGVTGGVTGGDKSRWVRGLERALAAGEVDLAVHSAKDVPGELADGLALFGAPARADVEDVLCLSAVGADTARGPRAAHSPGDAARGRPAAHSPGDAANGPHAARGPDAAGIPLGRNEASDTASTGGLGWLPTGARVGTSSLRRAAQLRAARDDLQVVQVRGNVDTRLDKLAAGGLDAIVLARAGLQRLGREPAAATTLDPAQFVPAPGQGALALEGRTGDDAAQAAVQAIADERTFACLKAERALAGALDASCDTPLGAWARDAGCGCVQLRAWVGLPDGSQWIADELLGGFYDPEQLGRRMAERMRDAGAGELLERAQAFAQSAQGAR